MLPKTVPSLLFPYSKEDQRNRYQQNKVDCPNGDGAASESGNFFASKVHHTHNPITAFADRHDLTSPPKPVLVRSYWQTGQADRKRILY